MKQRSIGRTAIAAAIVVGVIAGQASFAGATTYWHSGNDYYYTGTSGGVIQCAVGSLDFAFATGAIAESYTMTRAKKNGYCPDNFSLPAEWIMSVAVVQVQLGGVWYQAKDQTRTNPATAYEQEADAVQTSPSTGVYWRGVAGHSVLLVGAARQDVRTSPGYLTG